MSQQSVPPGSVTLCKMFGIDPPRLLTRKDIEKRYRRMPLVAKGIWDGVDKEQREYQQKG